MQPRIEILPETNLIGKRLTMSFSDNKTGELWRNFMPVRNLISNTAGPDLYSVQLYQDGFFENFNPNTTFEKWAAIAVTGFENITDNMESFLLKGGLYAVFKYKGDAKNADETFRYILMDWLPKSGYILDDRPHFEILGEKYKKGSADSEEEIWIPIKSKDNNQIAVAIFDKLAEVYEQKFMDVTLYHNVLNLFCDSIATQNASVLELACGPGNITKYLLQKRPDLKILATDLSSNMIALAKANNQNVNFRLLDSRKIDTLDQKYDAIMCSFCLPYLSKEESAKLILDAYKLLAPGGIIYISTMEENEDNKSGIRKSSTGDEMFMHFHRIADLNAALDKAGFKTITSRQQDFPSTDGLKTTDLIIIARK